MGRASVAVAGRNEMTAHRNSRRGIARSAFVALALLACTVVRGNTQPLEVAIAVTVEGVGTPTIVGVTNLPDDSKLLVTLRRRAANYMAQAHGTVVRGTFSAGPFSAHGSSVPSGDYEVEVIFPLARIQPSSVRKVVGENNERLKGRLVKKEQFGIIARQTQRVNIGGGASPDADAKARADNEIAMKKWRLETCEFISRVSGGTRSVADCVRNLERRSGQ
jgi:hypothetical protein